MVQESFLDLHIQHQISLSFCSSIAWSQYHKGMLASSDYEGTVTLWDAFAGTHTRLFQVMLRVFVKLIFTLFLRSIDADVFS